MDEKLLESLKEVDESRIVSFFDSYIIETDYFNCQREDLISLKEYLLELKYRKREYNLRMEEVFSLIKQNNASFIGAEPYFDGMDRDLVLFEKDRVGIITSVPRDRDSNIPVFTMDDIRGYDISLLDYLAALSKNFPCVSERNGFVSASGNFFVDPMCFSFVEVILKNRELIARLGLEESGYEVKEFNPKYLKRYTRDNVKRIYIPRK